MEELDFSIEVSNGEFDNIVNKAHVKFVDNHEEVSDAWWLIWLHIFLSRSPSVMWLFWLGVIMFDFISLFWFDVGFVCFDDIFDIDVIVGKVKDCLKVVQESHT